MSTTDDDGMGLVIRYSNADNYYMCQLTNDRQPDCNDDGETVSDGLYLYEVDTSKNCNSDDYRKASTSFTFTSGHVYRMRLEANGGTIKCSIDVNGDGSFTGSTDKSVTYTDSSPRPSGLVGLVSYDNGNADVSTDPFDLVFDNVKIEGTDTDTDADRLSDATETGLGTSTSSTDSDGDGIDDADEVGMPALPKDTDGDGTIDALDTDSDGDGIDDSDE
jgi:hypothetical protein